MSDRDDYVYPERVRYEIPDQDISAYKLAAGFINREGYEVLSVQHEYGIFGGEAGAHLMRLVREAKMPIVTTLHTVLRDPSHSQKTVMDELLQLSERVIVMSEKAVGFLREVHDVGPEKIDLIPHGIPEIDASAGVEFRASLGIEGPMILTFGLLSPDKGIQYVIEAMPRIVKDHPGATYVVVGATHPNVRASAGEAYRESLVKLAEDLGVSANVRFVDRFVTLEELVQFLGAMDIYVTPYLNPKQITSGTLAYAVGAGKAVISTPYWYAEELLADGRGMLVPFRDAVSIAGAVLAIQNDPVLKASLGSKAAAFGEQMLWPSVGASYLATFARAKKDSAERLRTILIPEPMMRSQELPALRLDHLIHLSDDTGILQHATFTTPNRAEGYCVDDNARALLFTALKGDLSPEESLLQSRYLSFLLDAYNPKTERFRNFMSYGREWLEESGSEDSHGRSLWALGTMVNRCEDDSRREVSKNLFEMGSKALYKTTSPRTWAYGALACHEYLQRYRNSYSVQTLMQTMASRLSRQFEINIDADWPWFEQSLSYANARLPQALIVVAAFFNNEDMLAVGLKALSWLMKIQGGRDGLFLPIGTERFYVRGGERSIFDQQPIEASSSVSACLSAARATGDKTWVGEAGRAFRWFLGDNILGLPVYDKTTGGCHDGLHAERVNRNQGAESTLAYLCARAELEQVPSSPAFVPFSGFYEVK